MNRILQMLNGRRIAIVGNSPVSRDYSAEIDSADIVIRFNHFYNYDSGLVGKRVDIVFQTVAQAWYDAVNSGRAHIDVVQQYRPHIYLVKRPDHYNTDVHRAYGAGIRVDNGADWFKPWWKYTTGTAVLCYLAQHLANAQVKIYGFANDGNDAAWKKYIETDARHYASVAFEERPAMLEAIACLENLHLTTPSQEAMPRCVVIPVKANSEGAPGKNHKLLLPCLEKVTAIEYPIYVTGDDYDLLHEAKLAFGERIATVPLPHIDAYDDVTKTLRKWHVETGFSGDMALVQCTSPSLEAKWIELCFDGLRLASMAATAVPLDFKPTAIFREENGVFLPCSQALPPASVARQLLPQTVRITGAVEAFHTDALTCDSIFNIGTLHPVIVDDALDVDTQEQLDALSLSGNNL